MGHMLCAPGPGPCEFVFSPKAALGCHPENHLGNSQQETSRQRETSGTELTWRNERKETPAPFSFNNIYKSRSLSLLIVHRGKAVSISM